MSFSQAHVFDILRSKFSGFRNFHTLLYTCAKEFDFLGTEMPWKTSATLLLPAAGLVLVLVARRMLADVFFAKAGKKGEPKEVKIT